jgi:hypothetical protein
MYNIHHTASTPGAADAFRPRSGRGRRRALRRRRGRLSRVEAVEQVEGSRLVALREGRVDELLH